MALDKKATDRREGDYVIPSTGERRQGHHSILPLPSHDRELIYSLAAGSSCQKLLRLAYSVGGIFSNYLLLAKAPIFQTSATQMKSPYRSM
jgi:hypothetical protein